MDVTLSARVDALLPQTQCTRCGFPTCRAYADAIATRAADIDRCPPGGDEGVAALATLLGIAPKPLDPKYGHEEPPRVAFIDEAICIGCTKCIEACPVDAIVGAARRMHTILAEECTGCELCLPPCPVDCIALVPIAVAPLLRNAVMGRAAHARERYVARDARLVRERAVRESRRTNTKNEAAPAAPQAPITRSAVLEAIARGKARVAARKNDPRA
jgi:H+/Na+-translocating ferredoxin:NAD+ oxidoreductase subunit B